VAQDVGPEFKPQYHKKEKRMINEIAEDMYKNLNEFKEDTNKQLKELKENSSKMSNEVRKTMQDMKEFRHPDKGSN
jgi:gas vesicle protein